MTANILVNDYTARGSRDNGTLEFANPDGKTVSKPITHAEWDLCWQVNSLISALNSALKKNATFEARNSGAR